MSGGSAQGTVSLTPPGNTVSGTDVTLTIEAEGPGGSDSNYAVLRLSVLSKVKSRGFRTTDQAFRSCEISVEKNVGLERGIFICEMLFQ